MVKSQNLDIVSSWNSMLVLLHGITGVRPFFHINNFGLVKKGNRAAVNLQSWPVLAASRNILRIEL